MAGCAETERPSNVNAGDGLRAVPFADQHRFHLPAADCVWNLSVWDAKKGKSFHRNGQLCGKILFFNGKLRLTGILANFPVLLIKNLSFRIDIPLNFRHIFGIMDVAKMRNFQNFPFFGHRTILSKE